MHLIRIWLCCFLPLGVWAQYDFTTVEENSKQLFMAQSWDKLLKESQEAIEKGIDFYDVRLRRGIAYLNKKQYRLANQEFKKARKFFPADTFSRYYACIAHDILGNEAEAQQNANMLPDTLRKSLGMRKQNLLKIGLFGNYATFNAEAKLTTTAQKEIGEWNAYRGLQGGGLLLSHLAGKWLSFQHSVTAFSFQNFKKVNYPPTQRVIFYNDGVQIGVNSHALVALPQNFKVNLSLQYNHIATYTQSFNNTKRQYETTDFSKGGLSIGGYVEKELKNIDLLLGTYWNNFLGYYTLQQTAGLTYYPFGNPRLSFRLQFSSLQNLAESNPDFQVSFLYFGKVSAQIHQKIWLSANYLHGDTQNFFDMENNAIYYTLDRTRRQGQGSLYFLLGKHLRLTLGYTFIERSGDQFVIFNPNYTPIIPIQYFTHQFSTALAWKF